MKVLWGCAERLIATVLVVISLSVIFAGTEEEIERNGLQISIDSILHYSMAMPYG